MERIIRSCIQVGNVPEKDDAIGNWHRLLEQNLEFPNIEDSKIYAYLTTFYAQMGAPPDFSLLKEHFEKRDEIEAVSRLEEIKKAPHYTHTNFLSIIRSEREQQSVKGLVLTLRAAQQIAEHGMNLEKPVNGKKILRGAQDALNYVFDKGSAFSVVERGEKLEGNVVEDGEEVLAEYDNVANNKTYEDRLIVGLEPVDSIVGGHKAGEFWVHTAFTSELKTTLAINYFYNNVYKFGKNLFYNILEMPYKQLRRQIFVVHSSHGKFVSEWNHEDRKNNVPEDKCYTGLNYQSVRDGVLTPLELRRFKIVAQDFQATCKGKAYIWRPGESDTTVEDIKRKAEMFHNKYSCDGIVIDHLGLVKPKHRVNDTVANLNSAVAEARQLALSFGRGKTVPVFGLFQLNRQGKMRADKADGAYDISAISYANEVEKSADVISYTYLNEELRRQGKFYMGCLKNRDGAFFEKMVGKIMWNSKRMRAITSPVGLLDRSTPNIMNAAKEISLTLADMMLFGYCKFQLLHCMAGKSFSLPAIVVSERRLKSDQ